ncbi:MAG: TolC family protein [Bacteroidales bacterium]|nr:TolC family protein [Bacteroidales bacterium]MDD4213416.1 TolC family protein [Bacteroidales bacterium]
MKRILLMFFIFPQTMCFPQNADTISLNYCQQLALDNYPLIKQKSLLSEASELKIKNLNTYFFPQLSLNGQLTYQSAVTEIPEISPLFESPSMSKDQYRLTLDLNQVLWDGGTIGAQKKLESANLQAEQMNIEVEVLKIKEQINKLYFNILLAQQNEKVIKNIQEDIKSKLKKAEAGVKNEILLQSNADIFKAEIVKTEQQLIELTAMKNIALTMLSEYINRPLFEYTVLQFPDDIIIDLIYDNKRPEMQLLDLQDNKLDLSKNLLNTRVTPRFYAFGQGGYGRPGFNMLSDDFDFFYIVGAKMSWNISEFYQYRKGKRIIDLQKNILNTQKETFDKNLKIASQKDAADVIKYKQLISKDEEIISLRSNITNTASKQLENGIITPTEYITELNAEMQARLNLETHKIQMKLAEINYMNLMGKL